MGDRRCQSCDRLISPSDFDFQIEIRFPAGPQILHLHALCYEQWLLETAERAP